ncbi:hypothetical protein [Heyndrickxia camelliae]|uniref:Uncharacterized protein n=1 Tax=Heyndrickxia camelliae TaxID=1707093 RepID=A0A2N3LJ33_9BACI|nr:hypothetical protein [Heyndrickxia camelliae]PKR84549.1 hypothetical protein CWO92_12600 [Heyndrickxia camelliae]
MIKGKKFLLFVMCLFTPILILPLLYTMGVPSFADVLTALFGEGSILATVFSLLLLLLIVFGVGKIMKRNA